MGKFREILDVIYRRKIDGFFAKVIHLFTKRRPLRDVILMESHNDFDCNGGAFYDYLIENHYNEKYKIVWLLKNPVPKHLPPNVKGYRLFRPSFMKAYYRCVAKIIAADDYMTQKVRPDQKEYYLTHGGITFKNVKGILVIQDHVDYVLSSSENYAPYVRENYTIPEKTELLYLGFPSNDLLFRSGADELKKISKDSFDKVFLWMPTFRDATGLHRHDSSAEQPMGVPLIESEEMYRDLNAFLQENRALLVIKIHPVQDLSRVKIGDMSNIKVITKDTAKALDLDLYRLMAGADACISDYSSVAYQYLMLNRPIGFVLSDLEEYKRGFSVENYEDFLPGEHIYTMEDLRGFLKAVISGEDTYYNKRTELLDFLYKYKDGRACERLAEFMGL